jgi:hypothetical protein
MSFLRNVTSETEIAVIAIDFDDCFSSMNTRFSQTLIIRKYGISLFKKYSTKPTLSEEDKKFIESQYAQIMSELKNITWIEKAINKEYTQSIIFGVELLNSDLGFRSFFKACYLSYTKFYSINPDLTYIPSEGDMIYKQNLNSGHKYTLITALLRYFRPDITKLTPNFYHEVSVLANKKLTAFIKTICYQFDRCLIASNSGRQGPSINNYGIEFNGNGSFYPALRDYHLYLVDEFKSDPKLANYPLELCDFLVPDALHGLQIGETMRTIEKQLSVEIVSFHDANKVDIIYAFAHQLYQLAHKTPPIKPVKMTYFSLDDKMEILQSCRQFFNDKDTDALSMLPNRFRYVPRHYRDGLFTSTLEEDYELAITGTGEIDYWLSENLRKLARSCNSSLQDGHVYDASSNLTRDKKIEFIRTRKLTRPVTASIRQFTPNFDDIENILPLQKFHKMKQLNK